MSESEPPTDAESTRPFDGRPPVEGVHRGAVEILDAIGQAVIATDLEGTVTYWSPAAEELYGWSAEEAVGRPVQRLTPSEAMRLRADEIMEEIRETGSWTGEFELTRRDGSRFTGLVTNALVHDREGRPVGMVGVSSDISDLKATEAALRERVKEMRTLIRATEILADGTRDRAARIQAFVDAIPSGWLDPDTTEALLTFDDQTYRSEGYRDSEHAIEHPVDVDGLATGRLRVVRTEVPAGAPAFIPEEVDLLRTLARTVGDAISRERSVRRLYRTVEALDVAIFLIESDTRVVRSANSAAERIFGRPREEMVGSTTEQLHVDRDRYEKFGEESARVLERGEVFHASIDMVRADGEVFPAEQTVSLLDPERGLEAGAVRVVRDMSEAHRARQEVARAQQRFRTIAEHLEDVLWIGSPADGAIEYVSPSYERVWGRHADRLLDDPGTWLEGVHPEDVAHVARTDVLDPTNHPLERDIQYRIVRPDGEVR